MSKYRIQEAEFDLPEQCQDRSINMFLASHGGVGEFSLVISREPAPAQGAVLEYADRALSKSAQDLPGFEVLRRGYRFLDLTPSEEVEYTWEADGKPMRQHQNFVIYQGEVLTLTLTAPLDIYPAYQLLVEHILSSWKFIPEGRR